MASQQAKQPDLTITVNRSDLETVMGCKAKFEGDRTGFTRRR